MAARSAKNTPANEGLEALVAQAVAQALANIPGAGIVVEADEPKPAAKPKPKPRAKRAPKPKPGVITCEIAWNLLGADPEYAPANPAKPATAPQLWRLNHDGLIADAIALAQ